MTEDKAIHCFEAAGLGKAPFQYMGMEHQELMYGERVLGHVKGVALTTKPGGTCDYCGTSIVNMFNILSADGKKFKVGCECVKKTGDRGLIWKADDDRKKMLKEREQKRIEQAKIDFYRNDEYFKRKPHPNRSMADRKYTMWDYGQFMFKNAGHSGTLSFARYVEGCSIERRGWLYFKDGVRLRFSDCLSLSENKKRYKIGTTIDDCGEPLGEIVHVEFD